VVPVLKRLRGLLPRQHRPRGDPPADY
jgi:hypothetical protein